MVDETPSELRYTFNVELSQKELLSLGWIVAQWASLEHEIFMQTLASFDDAEEGEKLPKAMDNLQFSEVLKLWNDRVVQKASNARNKEVLSEQLERIDHYQDFRHAIAHSMWEWDPADLSKIKATRIRKREIISVIFTAADLGDFALALAEINFNVRNPGGGDDVARAMAEKGYHVSRIGAAMLTGHPIIEDLIPDLSSKANQQTRKPET